MTQKKPTSSLVAVALAACFLLAACAEKPAAPPSHLTLDPVRFSDLPGWQADHESEALPAFQHSCGVMMHEPVSASLNVASLHVVTADYKSACTALGLVPPGDDAAARAYFERYFQPYAADAADNAGLFTGYYEAELHGSPQPGGRYQTPLYGHPHDLIAVDLGDFSAELKGKHIAGKVVDQKLKPYDDRAAIAHNSLQGRADVIAWVDDPVDAFFLAVQGSGRLTMTDNSTLRVGFDGTNGRSYVAIGRVMADAGDIEKPVTMQKIRAWLASHPDQAQTVMDADTSYVFFRTINGDGPIGAEGVPLTPRRSLAVDPAFIHLGTPLWLETKDGNGTPIERLMVAQDTGGAIKGPLRGDFFWGYGADAAASAGAMQGHGTYYLLLPKSVARD